MALVFLLVELEIQGRGKGVCDERPQAHNDDDDDEMIVFHNTRYPDMMFHDSFVCPSRNVNLPARALARASRHRVASPSCDIPPCNA